MKKVKIDDKSKFYYAVILTICIVAAAFFLGYRNFEKKATNFNNDNNNLENRIKDLEQYYLTEEQNKADTDTMIASMKSIFATYPGDARFEDGIFEAYNLYTASGKTLEFESIGFNTPEAVKEIPVDTVLGANIEEYQEPINFYSFDVLYRGIITYDGLKGMVEEISNNTRYNLAIGSMQYSIDDKGYISGSTLLSFYCVDGVGSPYVQPPVNDYETGLSNLFGVMDLSSLSPEEDD